MIEDASAIMAPLGDGGLLLDVIPSDTDLAIKMWPTDSGIVIATYSKSKSTIESLSFHLSDERPKSTRRTFDFKMTSYDPSTGKMTITVPNRAMKTERPDKHP